MSDFVAELKAVVGPKHVMTDPTQTERFRKGFRSGEGEAEAVVEPGSLLELWKVLQVAVAHHKIVIMQAANTGLTEGSTPNGEYDRNVVIINVLRLNKLHVIDNGKQIVSHSGGTLYELEALLKPLKRQPHSVIGSSCIGASIVGGVCNNSGGSLVQRGPSYTELSVYAQLNEDGRLELVNHLGIDLGDTPDEILTRLDQGAFTDADVRFDAGRASDSGYEERVRDIDAPSPARFNADPGRLHEASGCAGKLAVFAVRLDTFPEPEGEQVYYVGTNSTAVLTELRRRMLAEFPELPVSGEYLHRECFDIARKYGKDTLLMIHTLGTARLPTFFALKGRMDAAFKKTPGVPGNFIDRSLQVASRLVPEALPKRLMRFRDVYEHHIILKVGPGIVSHTEQLLQELLGDGGWFQCTPAEAKKAMLHRFAAAGAAVRYQAVHANTVEDIIALDIALRRNDEDWFETLPSDILDQLHAKMYYGHFFCHVFHQDYIVKKGCDAKALKRRILDICDRRGAEYPAEHNVGHLYEAKPELRAFYEELDPTNSFNPGIGKTSKQKRVRERAAAQMMTAPGE
ncbi:MAG: D-lactate dehydrogenase [Pseudomonadota bacterium]